MTFKASVWLHRAGDDFAQPIGVKELVERPVKFGHVRFAHRGKIESGLAEMVQPEDWEDKGVVPKVIVRPNPGE